MHHGLAAVCGELSNIQLQLLQRQGSPLILAHEGVQLLREHLSEVEISTSRDDSTARLVPKLLRACATVMRHVPEEDALAALDALDHCATVTRQYSEGGHVQRNFNFSEVCSLLRSVSALDDCQARLLELTALPPVASNSGSPSPPLGRPLPPTPSSSAQEAQAPRRFDALLTPIYHHAMQLWVDPRENTTTLSILSLLEANSRVHGRGFSFPAASADQNGLLPIKAKIQMEAKMQRCRGARGILAALRDRELNRVDAGMSLATMAQTGLYDPEVCNRSCETLYTQHALLSSQQLCQVIYHLGTLQHRHIHQKYFSSLVEPRDCNAEAVRQHVLGLAMLRQPPPSETALMNGVFLHALRAAHANRRSSSSDASSPVRGVAAWTTASPPDRRALHLSPSAQRAIQDPLNDSDYTLAPQWFIDVGHGLCCLGIQHPKYKLMTARQTRRSIGRLTTAERCKLLYAIGGLTAEQVPVELQSAWHSKVERSVAITAEKLKDIEPHEGPYVMNALLHCGIRSHPRIPRAPKLELDENPIDVLLSTWSTVPKERVLELTEQIKPQHLRTSKHDRVATTATLTRVVARVAEAFDVVPEEESYRLEPLCAAVDAHSAEMTVEDTMRTLQALWQMGRTGPRQQDAVRNLLMNLWTRRYDLEGEQLTRCCDCVQHWAEIPEAMQLLQFAASQ